MSNRDEIVSLIVRSIGTEDLARLMKALEATGMSADQAKAAIDKLAVSQTQATRTADTYSAATSYLQKANERAERVISGVSAAEQRLQKDMIRTAAIRDAGGKNAQLAAQVFAKQEKQMEVLRAKVLAATNGQMDLGAKTKLSAFQMQNLSYQINDVVSGFLMGQKPTQILFQQGGQIAQVFGGLGTVAKSLFSPTGLMVAGVAASGLAFAGVIAKAISLEKEFRALNATGIAYGNRNLSPDTLQRMSWNMSSSRSFTRSGADAALAQLQRANTISASAAQQIAQLAPYLASGTGGDLSSAMKELTDDFGKGYAGVAALDKEYNFLTATQRDHIRTLYLSGDAADGWREALDALLPQMKQAAKALKGPLSESLVELQNNIDKFTRALASSPAMQALIEATSKMAAGGADWLNGKSTPDSFVARGGVMYGVPGAIAGGMMGAPLGPFGIAGGALAGGLAGTFAGESYSNWLLANGQANKVPSAGGAIPWEMPPPEGGAANDNDPNRKLIDDMNAEYVQRIAVVRALTDADRDRLEVTQKANEVYGAPGQERLRAAYISNELGLRDASRTAQFNRDEMNAPRLLGYQQQIAASALQGPAAHQAMQDAIGVRQTYEPLISQARTSREVDILTEQMNRALENAQRTRASSNLDATNTGIASQQKEIALLQQRLGLVGKSTEAQNAQLASYQALSEMQQRYGNLALEQLPQEARDYVENARQIAKMNAELLQHQAILNEIGQFGDQIFDRIGSAMTDMAMNGKSALEGMRNVGSAVASELYQEFAKLALINPIKNALGISGGSALPTLGTVAAHLLGFADGGLIGGVGTGRSDSNFARVSRGEYVVNADATAKYLPVLDAINENRMRAFADGGLVAAPTVAAPRLATVNGGGSTSNVTFNIPITVNGSAGTQQQNADLAKQMVASVREVEPRLRALVRDEMRQQQRDGGMLYGGMTA